MESYNMSIKVVGKIPMEKGVNFWNQVLDFIKEKGLDNELTKELTTIVVNSPKSNYLPFLPNFQMNVIREIRGAYEMGSLNGIRVVVSPYPNSDEFEIFDNNSHYRGKIIEEE